MRELLRFTTDPTLECVVQHFLAQVAVHLLLAVKSFGAGLKRKEGKMTLIFLQNTRPFTKISKL